MPTITDKANNANQVDCTMYKLHPTDKYTNEDKAQCAKECIDIVCQLYPERRTELEMLGYDELYHELLVYTRQ